MRKLIAITLIFTASSFSGIPIDVDGKVSAMISDYKNGIGYTHKSGLIAQKFSYPQLNQAVISPNEGGTANSLAEWNGKKFRPFVLEHDPILYKKMAKAFKSRIKTLADIPESIASDELEIRDYHKDTLSYLSTAPGDLKFDFLQNFEYYKAIGEDAVSDLSGAVEYDNYEITTRNGAQLTLDLRFRRIFRGGVVRGNVSYVYVGIEKDGTINKIRAKWPKFSFDAQADKSYAQKEKKNMDEALGEARSRMENISDISNNVESIEHPQKGTIESMALAWIPENDSGKVIVKPGFSFISKIDYDDGVTMHPFTDVLFDK